MTIYGPDGQALVDVHALPIEEKDLIILRSDREMSVDDYQELQQTVLASNPKWRGGLLLLKTDEKIEKLDSATLLNLYELLKQMFSNWDKYVEVWESDTEKCVRCGQTLPAQAAAVDNGCNVCHDPKCVTPNEQH